MSSASNSTASPGFNVTDWLLLGVTNAINATVDVELSSGCFEVDANGKERVEFDTPLSEDAVANMLIMHRILNSLMCAAAVIFNLLLSIVIYRTKTDVVLMRPILLLNSIIDCVWSLVYLVVTRFRTTGFRRYMFFSNNPWLTNRSLTTALMITINVFTNLSWDIQPLIFVWRWYSIKTGHRPRGLFLILMLAVWIGYEMCHSYDTVFLSSNYIPLKQEFLDDSLVILKQYGYLIRPDQLYGSLQGTSKFFDLSSIYPIVDYIIVIVSVLGTRSSVQAHKSTSTATRKLESSLNRMLFALATIPMMSNVLPNRFITYTSPLCAHYPILNLISLLFVASAQLTCPIATFFFIKPYRRDLLKLITGGQVVLVSTTNQAINNSSQQTNQKP